MSENDKGPSVAVVGAGISGLTAALQLAKRGYDVHVYEKDDVIGGNLSSQPIPSPLHEVHGPAHPNEGRRDEVVYHDVYPHMFAGWYLNFWRMLEKDLGLSREGNFARRDSVKVLRKNERDYIDLPYPTNPRTVWEYLTSGFVPLPDMFIYGYSMIDLAAQHFEPDALLSNYSLNGFLNSRGYSTERAAEFLDLAVMVIWSIHGFQTSAKAYRDFVQRAYAFGTDQPFAWVLKGSLEDKLIRPLVDRLEALGCTVQTRHCVEGINVKNGEVHLEVHSFTPDKRDHHEHKVFDFLVLAVDPRALGLLIQSGTKEGMKGVTEDDRIIDRLPDVSEVRRLRSEPIPVVDLYFKHELPDIPPEHIGLAGSKMRLSCAEISSLWVDDENMRGRTALVLAASDFYALPIERPLVRYIEKSSLDPRAQDDDTPDDQKDQIRQMQEDGFCMIQEFHEYLPIFKTGSKWGDPSSDIDWEKTHFRTNLNHQLFINEVGSGTWGPCANYQALPNVFFAGDFCNNEVAMATVEGAVLSGLQAAEALWKRHPLGEPIQILDYPMPSESSLLGMKLALSANAYWARWFSLAYDAIEPVSKGDLSVLPGTAASMLYLPYRFGGEVLQTAYEFGRSLLKRR